MTLKEFAALKKGDQIVNGMSESPGTVSQVIDAGVYVAWGSSDRSFFYHVNSTAWTHWRKAE